MKELFILILSLAIAGFAFAASNSSTVTQTGGSNTAAVDQTGNTNTGTITQTGDLNTVKGSKWHAFRGETSKKMQADGLKQSGDNNSAQVTQLDKRNGAALGQIGSGNSVTIFQDIAPLAHGYGAQNNAFVDQIGNSNSGDITQNGIYSQSFDRQIGNNNQLYVNQGGYDYAEISQTGNSNIATQSQSINGWTTYPVGEAFISQSGDFNNGTQIQNGLGNNAVLIQNADHNIAQFVQNGNSNIAKLTQSIDANANVLQQGNSNIMQGIDTAADPSMGLSLNGSTLNLTQTGDGNVLKLSQTNGGVATVTQTGMTNAAVVIQN